MKVHPTVPSKEDRAAHSPVGDEIHPYSKRSGRYTIMAELHCHASLSASAEHRLGAEPAPRVWCGGSDVGCVGCASGNHLIKGSLVDERLRRPYFKEGATVEQRCSRGSTR